MATPGNNTFSTTGVIYLDCPCNVVKVKVQIWAGGGGGGGATKGNAAGGGGGGAFAQLTNFVTTPGQII